MPPLLLPISFLTATLTALTTTLTAANMPPEVDKRLALEIYKQIVEIKSGFATGTTTPIVDATLPRLKAAVSPIPTFSSAAQSRRK